MHNRLLQLDILFVTSSVKDIQDYVSIAFKSKTMCVANASPLR